VSCAQKTDTKYQHVQTCTNRAYYIRLLFADRFIDDVVSHIIYRVHYRDVNMEWLYETTTNNTELNK